MKIFYFFVCLLAVKMYSACDDVQKSSFVRILDGREWQDMHEVYKPKFAGEQHKVLVHLTEEEDAKAVAITSDDYRQGLLIFMNFSEDASVRVQTSINYYEKKIAKNVATITSYSSREQNPVNLERGVGVVDLCMPGPGGSESWALSTPYPGFSDRPQVKGVIYGDANHIEVTQYLLCNDDDCAHFIRMIVQYSDLGEVRFMRGQERGGGVHVYGSKAKTNICVDKFIQLGDPEESPEVMES